MPDPGGGGGGGGAEPLPELVEPPLELEHFDLKTLKFTSFQAIFGAQPPLA